MPFFHVRAVRTRTKSTSQVTVSWHDITLEANTFDSAEAIIYAWRTGAFESNDVTDTNAYPTCEEEDEDILVDFIEMLPRPGDEEEAATGSLEDAGLIQASLLNEE